MRSRKALALEQCRGIRSKRGEKQKEKERADRRAAQNILYGDPLAEGEFLENFTEVFTFRCNGLSHFPVSHFLP